MLSVQASGLSKMTKLNGPYIVKDVTSLAKGADKTEELVRLDAFSKGFQDSDTFKKTGRTLRKFALSNSFNDAVMKETIPSNMSNSELWGRHVPKETFEPMVYAQAAGTSRCGLESYGTAALKHHLFGARKVVAVPLSSYTEWLQQHSPSTHTLKTVAEAPDQYHGGRHVFQGLLHSLRSGHLQQRPLCPCRVVGL